MRTLPRTLATLLVGLSIFPAFTRPASAKAPSRKDFIAKADSVCVATSKVMTGALVKMFPGQVAPDDTGKLKFVNTVLIPNMAKQWKAIFALDQPKKDKDTIANIKVLADQEQANLVKHPDDALFKDPYNQTNLALSDFGFKDCVRNKAKPSPTTKPAAAIKQASTH